MNVMTKVSDLSIQEFQSLIRETILEPKLSDFEAEAHFMMQKILLKQQF
jgi:hypothetical protein